MDTGLTRNDIERETAKAYLFRVAVGCAALNDHLVWVPKSQVEWKEPQDNGHATAHVPEWLAKKVIP
jgi:hypothetical protein